MPTIEMDTTAHLALFAKAKSVFERPGKFVSFPALSPLSYSPDQLRFNAPAADPVAARLVQSEFSRIVNQAPGGGTIFDLTDGPYLWDIYKGVLAQSEVAIDSTPSDAAAYNAAVAFLTTTDSNGLKSASAAQIAYKQYRDAYFQALQNYNEKKLSAEMNPSASVQSQWHNSDEPQLRSLIDQANNDWVSKGSKLQVEAAELCQQRYAACSPTLTWNNWRGTFNPDIDIETDTNNQPYALIGFAPSNIFADDWPTFSLESQEITNLAAQAPKELKEIFTTTEATSQVQRLSFGFRSVEVTRPWYLPPVFEARFWRSPKGVAPLSDGASLPTGRWPSYVIALVFIRNIQITMKSTSPTPQPQPLTFLPAVQQTQLVFRASPKTAMFDDERPPPRLTTQMRSGGAALRQTPGVMVDMVERPAVLQRSMLTQPVVSAPAVTERASFARLNTVDYSSLKVTPSAPGNPPAQSDKPPPQTDTISILAFICKAMPKTPDPDPALVWPS